MPIERFFQTTRGRIVSELRRRRSASAHELAAAFGRTTNAVRQHLAALERDGLVEERSVRRGPTKPTIEFSLTADGEQLFPQRYDKMLAAVLAEVRRREGALGVQAIFDNIARRAAGKQRARSKGATFAAKVAGLRDGLRNAGVDADYDLVSGGAVLHEHNCPYATIVKDHPEVCSMIHHLLDDVAPGGHIQTESLARGGAECRFELKAAG